MAVWFWKRQKVRKMRKTWERMIESELREKISYKKNGRSVPVAHTPRLEKDKQHVFQIMIKLTKYS